MNDEIQEIKTIKKWEKKTEDFLKYANSVDSIFDALNYHIAGLNRYLQNMHDQGLLHYDSTRIHSCDNEAKADLLIIKISYYYKSQHKIHCHNKITLIINPNNYYEAWYNNLSKIKLFLKQREIDNGHGIIFKKD